MAYYAGSGASAVTGAGVGGGSAVGAGQGRGASPSAAAAAAGDTAALLDGVTDELDALDLEAHAEQLAKLLAAPGGAGADAAQSSDEVGGGIHPALVLLNHRFLSEVQRHERALEALRAARGDDEAQPELTTTPVEFHYGAQHAYGTPPSAGVVSSAGSGAGASAGSAGASAGNGHGSAPRLTRQAQTAGHQGNLFFMAALQLLEARAEARRGMLRGDGGVGSDGVSDAGTDEESGGMPSFASPSPARRSDDNSSSDVVMTGYLSKHSDFHWKNKWVVVRYGELSYASGPNAPARRFKRVRLDAQCVVQAVNSGSRRTNFVITNLSQRGSKRTWRAKSEQERQRWIDALLLASQSRTARADEGLWAECTRVYKCVQAAHTRDAYVRTVWSQLQGRRIVVPVSWVNDQLHRTRAGAGRATLDQMLKDMQRDSLWVNGQRVTGVTHPVGALTRAIFQFGLRSGVLTEEWQALELAYEVLINTTRTTCGGDSYDAVSHMLTVPMLMILCPLSQDAHPLRYSISLDQPSIEAQHAGATAIPTSVLDGTAAPAADGSMHGAHPLHANRVGLAMHHRSATAAGPRSTPNRRGAAASGKLFVQFETQMAYKIVDTDPQDTESATWATVTVTMRRVFIYYNNTATALDEGVAVIETQLSPYYRGKFTAGAQEAEATQELGSHRRSHSTPLGWAAGLLSHMGHASRDLDDHDTPDDTESERGSTAGGVRTAPTHGVAVPMQLRRKERGDSVSSALSSVSSAAGAHGGLALSPVVRPAPPPARASMFVDAAPLPPPAPRSTAAGGVGAEAHGGLAQASPSGLDDDEDWELVHAQVDQAADAAGTSGQGRGTIFGPPHVHGLSAADAAAERPPSNAAAAADSAAVGTQGGEAADQSPEGLEAPGPAGVGAGATTASDDVSSDASASKASNGDPGTTPSDEAGAADPTAVFMRDVQARLANMAPPPPPDGQSAARPAVPPGARSRGFRQARDRQAADAPARRTVLSPKNKASPRNPRRLTGPTSRVRGRSPLATSRSPRASQTAPRRGSPTRGARASPRGGDGAGSRQQPRDARVVSRMAPGRGEATAGDAGGPRRNPGAQRTARVSQRWSQRGSQYRGEDEVVV